MSKKQKTMSGVLGAIFIVTWVFGELFSFQRTVPSAPSVLLVAVEAFLVLINIRHVKLNGLFVRFSAILGLSWIFSLRLFSIQDAFPGLLYLLRFLLFLQLFLLSGSVFIIPKQWVIWGLWAFVGLGLAQYVLLPDTRFLLHYGWDEHYYRLIGTVLDPNYMGAMLAVIILWSLSRCFQVRNKQMLLLAVASLVAEVLTFSRASWLATGIGLLYFLYQYRFRVKPGMTKKAVMVVAIICTAIFFLAPKPGGEGVNLLRSASISQRIESWQHAFGVFWQHPFFGVGFNNYKAIGLQKGFLTNPESHAAFSPDSSWLLFLATLGGTGVIWAMGVMRKSIATILTTPEWGSITLLLAIHACFNNTLFYTPVLGLLILLRAAK